MITLKNFCRGPTGVPVWSWDVIISFLEHSRPDITNATRELSKANDGSKPSVIQELLRLISYELNTKNLGLKLKPTMNAS